MLNKHKKFLLAIVLIMTAISLVACSKNTNQSIKKADDKLNVVVTNSILADMTKNIAKDKINLHSIVPVGKDPHEYEPLPDDVQKTSRADLIFYNGINLETGGNAWFTKLVKNANKKENVDYFPVSKGVDVIYLEGKSTEGKEDPHAWLNLENGIIYAQNIEKELSKKDPDQKDFYQNNLNKYINKLTKLDKEAKAKFASIPENKKMIVTSEGCFKYFSKAYDIPSAYIWEINTEEEGSPEQIKTLVRKLRASDLKSLFVESSVDKRPMKTVAKDTNIPIYSTIFTDSVAKSGENGDSYYRMMEWNINKIYDGLSK
ncbi:metal ABC transporter substrate-binding protein [Lactococcus sp.]|uniref:metal ABC transporter substrate-binding protein n=1 Tax=Lactococcus sp. TaxID=44273 RepID=UPI002FC9EDB8